MWAMPLGAISIERRVVALVLVAPVLMKVRGSETNDDEDLEGMGDGGEVGGMGRIDASSSASTVAELRQDERAEVEEGLGDGCWLMSGIR